MESQNFLKNFAEIFDDTDASEIKIDTNFRDLDEWSSLTALMVIAFAKTKYDRTITGAQIRECDTVNDLFDLITTK